MNNFLSRSAAKRPVEARISCGGVCPICENDDWTYLFSKAQSRQLRCAACNLLRIEQRPELQVLTALKTGTGNAGFLQDGMSETDSPPTSQFWQQALSLARASLPSIRAATVRVGWVGQQYDGLAIAAGELGMELSFIEPDRLNLYNQDAGLPGSQVQNNTPAPPSFDACIVAIPLETWDDPLSTLHAVHRLLAHDGFLLIACKNLMPVRPRYADWVINRRTRYLYNQETATALMFRAGYGRIKALDTPLRYSRRAASTGGSLLIASKRYSEDPATHRNKLSIIMPVFNEKATFAQVFETVFAKTFAELDKEIIVIESNSTDGSREDVLSIGNRAGVKVILEDRPRGKGFAVRQGLAQATGDIVIIQDADLEYDIEDYDLLLDPLIRNRAAFVLGTRHGREGGGLKMRRFDDQIAVGLIMNFAHVVFTQLFNVVYGQRLADPFTMFKVFRRDCIDGLTFESNRFDFDWEIVAKLVRRGYIPVEIPINYTSRSFSAGKKVSFFRDPLTWIVACFKYRFVKL